MPNLSNNKNQSVKPKTLGEQLKRGVFWRYSQTIFVTGFNFCSGVILARLLDPADFGVFAAVTSFTNLMLLQVNFGWPSALLRAKQLEEPLLSTVFWIMQGAALFLMLLVLLAAPLLENLYADQRFSTVMVGLSVQFFIAPYNTINGSILRQRMRYDLVSQISMVVMVLSTSASIVLAFLGFGVYSLVVSGILSSLLLTVGMAFFAPWKPKLSFSISSVSGMFSFSWRLHLNNTLNRIANRVDNMLIGKVVGIAPLGLYVKAFSLSKMPINLLATNLYQMFFTALCHRREDLSDSIRLFQKMLSFLSLATCLPLMVLFLIAEGFIVNLYGIKWIGATLPTQIMIIGSFPNLISMTCGAFCDAQNLVKRETRVQGLNVLMTVAAIAIGSHWGLEGVACGIALKGFILVMLMKQVLSKGIGLQWQHLWDPIWPNLSSTLLGFSCGGALIYFIGEDYDPASIWQMLLIGGISTLTYIGVWILLANIFRQHKTMGAVLETMRDIFVSLRHSLSERIQRVANSQG